MQQHEYVNEKLREVKAELDRQEALRAPGGTLPPPRRRLIGPAVRVAGRHVRRVGEALESWAAPQSMAR